MSEKNTKDYSTLQIGRVTKSEIVDHCQKEGKKIGRFVESLWKEYKKQNNIPSSDK